MHYMYFPSDTVTRSAIFCSVTNTIECCKVERTVDIFQAVKVLRSQRPGAIPTVVIIVHQRTPFCTDL